MTIVPLTHRKYRFFLAGLFVAMLVLPGSALAQTGIDALRFSNREPATGPRMMGMAGAGRYAGISDYTALIYNPAGLGLFTRSTAAGALTGFSAQDNATFEVAGNKTSAENDLRSTRLTNLAYAYKFPTRRGALVIGASYNQVASFDRELVYEAENPGNSITDYFVPVGGYTIDAAPGPDGILGTADDEFDIDLSNSDPFSLAAWETFAIDFSPDLYYANDPFPFLPAVSAGTVRQKEWVTERGRINEITIGGGWEAARGVLVGFSLGVPFGTYRFDRRFEEDDIYDDNDGTGNTTDFDYLTYEEGFESDIVGIVLRGGLSAELTRGLRAGLTIETPTFYNIDEDYYTFLETVFDNADSYRYGDLAGDAGNGSFEYQIRTPWRFGAGLSYTTPRVLISAGAEYVDWSQLELDASSSHGYFDRENAIIRQDYNAVLNTHLGGEVWLGNVALRAGLAFQPDPVDDGGVDRSKTFLSAGIGYRFAEQLQLDFGFMQERFDDQWAPYSLTQEYQDVVSVSPAPVVSEEIIRNRFAIGLKYMF